MDFLRIMMDYDELLWSMMDYMVIDPLVSVYITGKKS